MAAGAPKAPMAFGRQRWTPHLREVDGLGEGQGLALRLPLPPRMTPQPWKKLASRDVLRDRWVRLRADRCEIAPGKIIDPYYVMEESEWVHVVAFDDQHHVLLVQQYRHAVEAVSWELPGGAADPGEPLLTTAQRELLEETGATGQRWRAAGAYFTNPGRQNNRVHGFVVEDVRIDAPQELDETEAIACAFFSVEEVFGLMETGGFSNSMHVALFYRALHQLGIVQLTAHQT